MAGVDGQLLGRMLHYRLWNLDDERHYLHCVHLVVATLDWDPKQAGTEHPPHWWLPYAFCLALTPHSPYRTGVGLPHPPATYHTVPTPPPHFPA